MNNPINYKPTEESPLISLDGNKGLFNFEGRSMPEDAYNFYQPIVKWLEDYVENPLDATQASFKMDYFNSGSVKQIFTILCILEELLESGKDISINWYYKKGDELMQSKGIEFNKFLDVDIQVIEY